MNLRRSCLLSPPDSPFVPSSPTRERMGSAEKTGASYGEYTYEALEREPYWPTEKLRISITGAGDFIGSHIARRLKSDGHYIIASDQKKNEHMTEDMFCHEFHLVDFRVMDNCLKVTSGIDHVFNLAADMGGMGFIQSNHSVIMYNNTMISFNMLEVARINGVKRWSRRARVVYVQFEKTVSGEWRGVKSIKTWKRLDGQHLTTIDSEVLWNKGSNA